MATFICEKCGTIDNSACGGTYHTSELKGMKMFTEDYANNMKLCVECAPTKFSDGSVNDGAGKWHNHFPKRHWTFYGKEKILGMWAKQQGDFTNAPNFFANDFLNNIAKECEGDNDKK